MVGVQFFTFGFVAAQAVVLAFGLDPASALLQIAALLVLSAGAMTIATTLKRARAVLIAVVASLLGLLTALALVVLVNAL